jgi:hypothetical protein
MTGRSSLYARSMSGVRIEAGEEKMRPSIGAFTRLLSGSRFRHKVEVVRKQSPPILYAGTETGVP